MMSDIVRIKSITEIHYTMGLKEPKHPLITMVQHKELPESSKKTKREFVDVKLTSDLYSVMLKDKISGSMTYGRNSYDFQHGTMVFTAPGQVMMGHEYDIIEDDNTWFLLFHPDLIRRSNLARSIDSYTFFGYESNEALHLSREEQDYITNIALQVKREYSQNLDGHSHQLIISNLELLLNNCLRFYDRQFYTRTNFNKDFVAEFDQLLKKYFTSNLAIELGVPAVSYFSDLLNMSTNYLSDMLRKETGISAKGHINEVLVDRAKSALLNSNESISEIAYSLGFEHPQSLTRLFKSKTGLSPAEYRNLN
jgi:AraC-like DNA-binding protein